MRCYQRSSAERSRAKPHLSYLLALALATALAATCSPSREAADSTLATGTPTSTRISVTIDLMQFLNANGATFEAKGLGSSAIPESEARRRASGEVPSLTVVQADSGLLTWPQYGLDHKEVWLVRLSHAGGAAPGQGGSFHTPARSGGLE